MSSLVNLLNQEVLQPRNDFSATFQDITNQYLLLDTQYQIQLKKELKTLYSQYNDMPFNEFMRYVKAFHLEYLIQPDQTSLALLEENCQQNMTTFVNYIQKSKTLMELDSVVTTACNWLTLDSICDANTLQDMQTTLRNQVLNRLERFLASSKNEIPELLTDKERESLEHILSHEKIIQSEEKVYFLEEFQRL
jgi:hypothetical protein